MKILHVLSTHKFSGAENVVCQIIKMFEGDVEMAYTSPDGEINESLKNLGVDFIPLKNFSAKEVKRVIKEYNPDIIHAHDVRPTLFSSMCKGKRKLICTVHGNELGLRKLSIKSFLFNKALKKTDKVIWVNKSSLESFYYKNKVIEKSVLLNNVVSIDDICKKSNEFDAEKYNVVFLGRLQIPKNPQRFIDVLNLIKQKGVTFNCCMIGNGELQAEVEQKIKDYNLGNDVKLLGFQSNPFPYLKNADVMVMTSDWEGVPMAALEAQTLGVPIVSTKTDGLCEIIVDGFNGFLSDDNNVLCEKIICLLTDKILSKKIKENSKQKALELNDIEKYKQVLLNIYNQ